MSSAMSQAEPSYIDLPLLVSPPVPAASTVGHVVIYGDTDQNLYMSIDGNPYVLIASSGGVGGTLDQAYDFGGAGAGRTITVDSGAVQLNGATAGASTIMGITQTAAASGAGAITGLAINMLAAGPNFAGATTVDVNALTIVGAFSSVAKTAATGLVSISSAYRNGALLSMVCKNKQATAGSIVNLGWSDTNYEGAVANSTLTGTTHMVTLDGVTFVTPGSVAFVNLRILTPGTTDGTGIAIEGANLGGQGILVTMTPGSSASVFGQRIVMASNVNSTSAGLNVSWAGTAGTDGTTNNGIVNVFTNVTGNSGVLTFQTIGVRASVLTLTGTLTAILADLNTQVTPGAQTIQGVVVKMGAATTQATTAFQSTTIQTAGRCIAHEHSAATTLSGTLVGCEIDIQTNVNATSQAIIGARYRVGATSNVSSGGVAINSTQTASSCLYITLAPASGTANGISVSCGANVNKTGITDGTGVLVTIVDTAACGVGIYPTVATAAFGQNAMQIRRQMTCTSSFTESTDMVEMLNTSTFNSGTTTWSQSLINVGVFATVAGATYTWSGKGVRIAQVITRTSGTVNLTGTLLTLEHAPVGTISTDTSNWITATSISKGGTGVSLTHTGTLASAFTGLAISLVGQTPGAQNVNGLTMTIPATTRAATNGEGALSIASRATRQYICETTVRNTGGTLWRMCRYDNNTTASQAVTLVDMSPGITNTMTCNNDLNGLVINVSANVAMGSNILTGIDLTLPTDVFTTSSGIRITSNFNRGQVINVIMSDGTTGPYYGLLVTTAAGNVSSTRAVNIDWRGTAGTTATGGVIQISPTASTTLTGALNGIYMDLATNVVPSNQTITGVNILMDASGSNGANASVTYASTRNGTLTTSSNFTGSALLISNVPARAAGAATENGVLISVTHAPTTGGGGALTDTTTGLSITMTPFSANATVGAKITMSANATGAALSITHSGTGANQDQLLFTAAADGTGAHLKGPVSGTLVIKSGQITGTATGNGISIAATDGSTTGAGGSLTLKAGSGVGANQNGGDVNLLPGAQTGAGVPGLVNYESSAFAISGAGAPATLTLTTGGATGPATAAQNQWLAVKIGGTINYIPVWQ